MALFDQISSSLEELLAFTTARGVQGMMHLVVSSESKNRIL
jgi:hypothetical protein